MDHLDRICATVFATVANHPASRWPGTGFALCGAQPPVAELLDRLQLPDFLPIHADIDEALAAVFARPPYLREELVLAPTLSAPAAARAFVRDTCVDWQLAQPEEPWVDRAVLLANELVANAVIHAGTDLRLRVELRGDLLHIAVRDDSPRLPRVVALDPQAKGGRGLWLVEQLARAWGCIPIPMAARSSGAPSSAGATHMRVGQAVQQPPATDRRPTRQADEVVRQHRDRPVDSRSGRARSLRKGMDLRAGVSGRAG